jgi:uncharacterized protein YwqG
MTLDDLKSDWTRRLEKAGLADKAGVLIADARPAVRFEPDPAAGAPVGASKLGGAPDLPPDFVWPTARKVLQPAVRGGLFRKARAEVTGDRALSFLIQIDLAQLATAGDCALALPRAGVLAYFFDMDGFYQPDDHASGKLFWFPDAGMLKRSALPDNTERQREAALTPEPVLTFSQSLTPTGLAGAELDAYLEFFSTPPQGAVQIGGWPWEVQNPVELECEALFVHHGLGREAFRAAKQTFAASDWRVVIQIDTIDALDLMWGDAGTLYVCMRNADIAARAFDKAVTVMQCH